MLEKRKTTFSVIVCTHNRSHYLGGLFSSLMAQTYPSEYIEIIIVDNASTDDTAATVRRLNKDQPQAELEYVFEPKLGLSTARNSGARAAKNDVVVYIDDDAEAAPDWLERLAKGFEEDASIVCIGGMIELLWDEPRPAWMPEALESYLGCNKFMGERDREYPAGLSPFGGNFAVRREILLAAPGFDPDFGRVGEELGANEEVMMTEALEKSGKVVYRPAAVVYHHVPAWRATKKYLLARGYHQGIANANVDYRQNQPTRIKMVRTLLSSVLFLLRDAGQIVSSCLSKEASKKVESSVFFITRTGYMVRLLQLLF